MENYSYNTGNWDKGYVYATWQNCTICYDTDTEYMEITIKGVDFEQYGPEGLVIRYPEPILYDILKDGRDIVYNHKELGIVTIECSDKEYYAILNLHYEIMNKPLEW